MKTSAKEIQKSAEMISVVKTLSAHTSASPCPRNSSRSYRMKTTMLKTMTKIATKMTIITTRKRASRKCQTVVDAPRASGKLRPKSA